MTESGSKCVTVVTVALDAVMSRRAFVFIRVHMCSYVSLVITGERRPFPPHTASALMLCAVRSLAGDVVGLNET